MAFGINSSSLRCCFCPFANPFKDRNNSFYKKYIAQILQRSEMGDEEEKH